MNRGKYICFEGGDGSGKTTLCAALCERLGDKAVAKCFPSDGVVGSLIRQGLMGSAPIESKPFLYLFAADGLQEELWIQDQLEEQGKHVICDRHPTLSGRVFQLEHHSTEQIEAVCGASAFDGISMPDVLFVVDIPADEALWRMKGRDKYFDAVFEKFDTSHIEKIRDRYLGIASRFGATILDGTKPMSELVDLVFEHMGW